MSSSASSTDCSTNPVEEDDSADQLPLSKKCRVSKAEKRLLNFVDDIVKTDKLTQCPAEKARTEVRRYIDEEISSVPVLQLLLPQMMILFVDLHHKGKVRP